MTCYSPLHHELIVIGGESFCGKCFMAGVDQERKLERRGKFCFIDEHDKLIDVISSLNEVFFSVPQPKVIEDKWKAIMFTSLDEASK